MDENGVRTIENCSDPDPVENTFCYNERLQEIIKEIRSGECPRILETASAAEEPESTTTTTTTATNTTTTTTMTSSTTTTTTTATTTTTSTTTTTTAEDEVIVSELMKVTPEVFLGCWFWNSHQKITTSKKFESDYFENCI